MIPNELIDEPRLSTTERVVLFKLMSNSSTFFPSLTTLASQLGISKPTVIAALKALEDKNVIERQSGKELSHFSSNIYVIKPKGEWFSQK